MSVQQKQTMKKGSPNWFQCEKCLCNILSKDVDFHTSSCPPSKEDFKHGFVQDKILHGFLDVKINEDIKNISSNDKDYLVFLSQTAIQLTGLSIGEWCIVKPLNTNITPTAKIVWPTTEKTATSVLLTKHSMELNNLIPNIKVTVSNNMKNLEMASNITLVVLNAPKSLELTPELQNRISKSHLGRVLTKGNFINVLYYGKVLKFEIKAIEGERLNIMNLKDLSINDEDKFFMTGDITKWKLLRDNVEFEKQEMENGNCLDKIGGLDEQIAEIKETIEAFLMSSNKINNFVLCNSILLYGNSGVGKTMLVDAIAKDFKTSTFKISPYNLLNDSPGEYIKQQLEEAIAQSPSILIFDEIDSLCPTRSSRLNETEKKSISNILSLFDHIESNRNNKVFILATTNKPDNIEPSLRRPGRLERELEIPAPNPKARLEILKKLLKQMDCSLSDEDVREVSFKTHGFVGADLVALCSRAALNAFRSKRVEVQMEDFQWALTKVSPSAMREVQVEVPDIKWEDIGGQEKLKLVLRQAVEWPLKYAESFNRLGITPPKGVLMFGPPGCSKTMIAKALATESGLNFLSIKGPELFSKWVGESERAVREVFRKARQVSPSIIFFDEIDALGGERGAGNTTSVQERVLAQLLTELDGVSPLGDVTVVAATNRPDRIDKALLRPGRLDRIVYVPLPDCDTRREIFKIKFKKMPVQNVDIEELVEMTEGYSGAEVNAVCHEAAMAALEEDLGALTVKLEHFQKALKMVTKRTPNSLLELYENYLQYNV